MGQQSHTSTAEVSIRSTSTSTGIRQRARSLSQQNFRGSPGLQSTFWSKSSTRGCRTAGESMMLLEIQVPDRLGYEGAEGWQGMQLSRPLASGLSTRHNAGLLMSQVAVGFPSAQQVCAANADLGVEQPAAAS